jgi:predicted dehydrogenase
MNVVRRGLIGLGVMGNFHFKSTAEVAGVRLTACVTRTRAGLDPAAVAHGTIRTVHEALSSCSKGKLVDAVLIATPHFLHPELSIAAMQRDLHVLTEKPVAVSVGAARK